MRFFTYKLLAAIAGVMLAVTPAAEAAVRLIDANTAAPLPAAAITDRNGNMLALTGRDGSVPDIAPDRYPVSFSYSGYEPLEISAPADMDIALTPRIYELEDLVVTAGEHPLVHATAFVRILSTSTGAADSITAFKEQIVDYLIPAGKTKIKGWRKARVLASKCYMRHTGANALDTVSDRIDEEIMPLSLESVITTYPDPSKMKVDYRNPEVLTDTVQGKYAPAYILTRSGDSMRVYNDYLANAKNHTESPWIMKALGLTMDISEMSANFLIGGSGDNTPQEVSISEFSRSCGVLCRGKLYRFLFNTDKPITLNFYAEVYLLEREYLTDADAKALKENPPVIAAEQIAAPEGAAPLHPAILQLKQRVADLQK